MMVFHECVFLIGRSSKALWAQCMELHLEYMYMRRLVRKTLRVRAVLIRCECRSFPSLRFWDLMQYETRDV